MYSHRPFLLSKFGNRQRSFREEWYREFKWLEYSVSNDGAYCYACRLFGKITPNFNNGRNALICPCGFNNWKRSLDSFREHSKTVAHSDSLSRYYAFQDTKTNGNILSQLSLGHEKDVEERRQYLSRMVEITRFLSSQGLAFRGNDECKEETNRGNFLETLNLLKKFDPFLSTYVPPQNCHYTSPESQNDLISACALETKDGILKEVRSSGMFAIMADEAKTRNVTEQLAICIRYVHNDVVKETFLGFVPLEQLNARAILEQIEAFLKANEISTLLCVAQAYDGAAVMSGIVGGVQHLFRELHTKAVYIHCYAHQLNLVLCAACKAIPDAIAFFNSLEALYTYFTASVKNHQGLKETKEALGIQESCELVQLSATRWACQIRAISALLKNFDALRKFLQASNDPTAIGLLKKIISWTFVALLFVFERLLRTTEGLHKLLQRESLDISHAILSVQAVRETIQEMRSDEYSDELFSAISTYCSDKGIAMHKERPRKLPARLLKGDVVIDCVLPSASYEERHMKETFRVQLFFPCVDRFLAELGSRFSSANQEVLLGVHACSPASSQFMDYAAMSNLASHYSISLSKEEVAVAKNYLQRQPATLTDILAVYQKLDATMFPTLKVTLQTALTIPVTSCSCERSFSALRRVHTALRGRMNQERLGNLSFLTIERDRFQALTAGAIIDRFAALSKRRNALQ